MKNSHQKLKRLNGNFTNILRAVFCLKVFCKAFLQLQFGFAIFGKSCSKNVGEIGYRGQVGV